MRSQEHDHGTNVALGVKTAFAQLSLCGPRQLRKYAENMHLGLRQTLADGEDVDDAGDNLNRWLVNGHASVI